jgi:D-lyxose ketol-isomerase
MMVKTREPGHYSPGQRLHLAPRVVHRFDAETGVRR